MSDKGMGKLVGTARLAKRCSQFSARQKREPAGHAALCTKVHQDRGFLKSIAFARPPEQAIVAGIYPTLIGGHVRKPSHKMRELVTALAIAFGLAVAAFGAAVLAATYVAIIKRGNNLQTSMEQEDQELLGRVVLQLLPASPLKLPSGTRPNGQFTWVGRRFLSFTSRRLQCLHRDTGCAKPELPYFRRLIFVSHTRWMLTCEVIQKLACNMFFDASLIPV